MVKDRVAWHAAVHWVAKSQTQLSKWTAIIHLWNHRYKLCQKPIPHLQKFCPTFFICYYFLQFECIRATLLIVFRCYNTALLNIGSILYSKSLGLIHLPQLKLNALWIMPFHVLSLSPSSWQLPFNSSLYMFDCFWFLA